MMQYSHYCDSNVDVFVLDGFSHLFESHVHDFEQIEAWSQLDRNLIVSDVNYLLKSTRMEQSMGDFLKRRIIIGEFCPDDYSRIPKQINIQPFIDLAAFFYREPIFRLFESNILRQPLQKTLCAWLALGCFEPLTWMLRKSPQSFSNTDLNTLLELSSEHPSDASVQLLHQILRLGVFVLLPSAGKALLRSACREGHEELARLVDWVCVRSGVLLFAEEEEGEEEEGGEPEWLFVLRSEVYSAMKLLVREFKSLSVPGSLGWRAGRRQANSHVYSQGLHAGRRPFAPPQGMGQHEVRRLLLEEWGGCCSPRGRAMLEDLLNQR